MQTLENTNTARSYTEDQVDAVADRLQETRDGERIDSGESLLEFLSPIEAVPLYRSGYELDSVRLVMVLGGPSVWIEYKTGEEWMTVFGRGMGGPLISVDIFAPELAEELFETFTGFRA